MQWAHFDSNRPRRSTTNTNASLKAALTLVQSHYLYMFETTAAVMSLTYNLLYILQRAVVEELLSRLWQKHNVTNKQFNTSEMVQEKCAQQDCDT